MRPRPRPRRYRVAACSWRRFCTVGQSFKAMDLLLQQGGELGQFKRGVLGKVMIEDQTFGLDSGKFTQPIRNPSGFHHPQGGTAHRRRRSGISSDVEPQVEESLYMERMEPAIRQYLTTLRDDSFIDIKPGYVDSGASPGELHSSIKFQRLHAACSQEEGAGRAPTFPREHAHLPAEVAAERVRSRLLRQLRLRVRRLAPAAAAGVAAAPGGRCRAWSCTHGWGCCRFNDCARDCSEDKRKDKEGKGQERQDGACLGEAGEEGKDSLWPGASGNSTHGHGQFCNRKCKARCLLETASAAVMYRPTRLRLPRSRRRSVSVSVRVPQRRLSKCPASKTKPTDALTPPPPGSTEVADRQAQAAPLGLAGDTATTKKKKKTATTTTEKTRLSQEPKKPAVAAPQPTIPAPVPGAPAPAPAPSAPVPSAPAPQPPQ